MYRVLLLFILLVSPALDLAAEGPAKDFREVWAYVYKGEEKYLRPDLPLTDVAHFSVVVNDVGRITDTLNPKNVRAKAPAGARVHCVVSAPFNKSLMYWCLRKDSETRGLLLDDIVRVCKDYDGVQIDFESIRPEDGEAYVAFLKDLRRRLSSEKELSVALPARFKQMNDGYPYKPIGDVVDRVLVMAYDEHWRSGPPGAIASASWCAKVAKYARQQISLEKLVMGIPLYGRVWQRPSIARALTYPQTLDLWKKVQSTVKREDDNTPHFSYEESVEGVVYYEDIRSLDKKLSAYQGLDIQSVGFWRLGQGPAALWQHIRVKSP